MKFKFNFKKKEVALETDVEKLVEKGIDYKLQRKTRYQIKAEERRKDEAQRHKQQMQWMLILLGIIAFVLILGFISTL